MIPDRRFKMQKAIESKENVKHVGEFWQIIDLIQWWLLSSHSVVSDFSVPGFSILRHLLKLAQTLVHWVGVAIQPSCPLLSPYLLPSIFPSIRDLSNESLLCINGESTGASASISVLPMNIQDWFPLGWTGWISVQSKGLSRVFSNTIVQKHQFFGAQLSSQSNFHIHTWLLEKP